MSRTDKPVALGFRIELEFRNGGFEDKRKTGVSGELKLSRSKERTSNKLNQLDNSIFNNNFMRQYKLAFTYHLVAVASLAR